MTREDQLMSATARTFSALEAEFGEGGKRAGRTFTVGEMYALGRNLHPFFPVPDHLDSSLRCKVQRTRPRTENVGRGLWRFKVRVDARGAPKGQPQPTTQQEKPMSGIVNGHGTPMSQASSRVTPKWAREVLAEQERKGWINRKLAPGKVKEMAAHMAAKTFEHNTMIQFAANGRLLDGWHRLTACADGGADFHAVILTKVPESAHVFIDIGTKRTLAHKLTHEGLVDKHRAAALVSALNTLDMYIDQAPGRAGVAAGPALARTQGIDLEGAKLLLSQHPDLHLSQDYVGTKSQTMSAAIMTTLHYLIARIAGKQREANAFIDCIKTGAYLAPNSPIMALRNLFLQSKPVEMTAFGDRLWITVETANRFLEGQTVRGGQFSKKDVDEVGPRVLLGADPSILRDDFPNLIRPAASEDRPAA